MAHTILFFQVMTSLSFVINEQIKFVKKCPYSSLSWFASARSFECDSGKVYHCVLVNNNKLAEICMRKHFLLPKDGCPWIDLSGSIDEFKYTRNCTEVKGCPQNNDEPYVSNNLYRYPGCFGNRAEEITLSTKLLSRYESTSETTIRRKSIATKIPRTGKKIINSSLFDVFYSTQTDVTAFSGSHNNPTLSKPRFKDSLSMIKLVMLIIGGVFFVLSLTAIVLSCRQRLTRIRETVNISQSLNEMDVEENVYDSIETVDDFEEQASFQSHDDENSFQSSNQFTVNNQDVTEVRLEYEEPAKNHYNKLDLHQAFADRELKEKVYNSITKETEFSGVDSFESEQSATQLEDTNDVHQETMEDK